MDKIDPEFLAAMESPAEDAMEPVRTEFLARIEQNDPKRYRLKIKNLMSRFGYTADHRVRQASLESVEEQLLGWGISCSFPGERSAHEWVVLSKTDGAPKQPPPSLPADKARSRVMGVPRQPLGLGLVFDETADARAADTLAEQLMDHVWACRSVCLVIDGDDSDVGFAAAILGALMRRRSLCIGKEGIGIQVSVMPEILSLATLARLVSDGESAEYTPAIFPGAVILVRAANDLRSEKQLALLRDAIFPHTYRVRRNANVDITALASWAATLAGMPAQAPALERRHGEGRPDVAALVTAASQLRDNASELASRRVVGRKFSAGFESSEHMALKASLFRYLELIHGAEAVTVESRADTAEVDQDPTQKTKAHRADLRVEGRIWVEIETLRWRAARMRDGFFELERTMVQRATAAKAGQELWLIVPSDVAALASARLEAIAANLRTQRSDLTVRWGYVDLEHDVPVFLQCPPAEAARAPTLARSWRERKQSPVHKLNWGDVAGYDSVKQLIEEDLVDPLKNPGKYREHGLTSASGLLLYGLPGCGKSLIGRVLASDAGLTCRVVLPSDLTSMWLGGSVEKVRSVFDWALEQEDGCLLVLDELDAVAPVRSERNMHTDEKRAVNELLVQLDRIASKPIMVVATTNYVNGIDSAVRRSGRFDVKVPVFPPTVEDRKAIFSHYIRRLSRFELADALGAVDRLAAKTPLFAPCDIEAVVNIAARRAVRAASGREPLLTESDLGVLIDGHRRSISEDAARSWLVEAKQELGATQARRLAELETEVSSAYPSKSKGA